MSYSLAIKGLTDMSHPLSENGICHRHCQKIGKFEGSHSSNQIYSTIMFSVSNHSLVASIETEKKSNVNTIQVKF